MFEMSRCSRYKIILSYIIALSEQYCKVYFISLTVVKPLHYLTTEYYRNRPSNVTSCIRGWCQQTLPKRWFANVNMTSYCDAISSVYLIAMTTIRHCSIPKFCRRDTIKQSPRAPPDLCTPLAPSGTWNLRSESPSPSSKCAKLHTGKYETIEITCRESVITLLLLVRATHMRALLRIHPVRGESHIQRNANREVARISTPFFNQPHRPHVLFCK